MALLKPCLSARLPILIRSGICSGLESGVRRRRLHSGSSWSAAARAAMEDFEFGEGPLEPIRPKFNRSPYAPSQLEPEKTTPPSSDPRPNRRRFRKPTPLQVSSFPIPLLQVSILLVTWSHHLPTLLVLRLQAPRIRAYLPSKTV